MLTVQNESGTILAYLNNLESGTIHESLNGEFTLEFIATIEPLKTEFLYDENNLIEYENDLFRVMTFEELHSEDNMLTVAVTAVHISYDLRSNIMPNFYYTNATAALVMTQALLGTGFTLTATDVTYKTDIRYEEECNSKQITIAIANNWQGELKYFRRDIQLLQQRGQNRGTDFRFGKNLKSIRRIVNRAENTVSYEVDVEQGSELQELGYYELGDTIRVIDDALNIDIERRIVDFKKDIITGLNSSVVLGDKIKDLRSSFSSVDKKISDAEARVADGITEAHEAADSARGIAEYAIESAQTANNLLADIANDNKLTSKEKGATKKEWDIIVAEYSKNDTLAVSYGIGLPEEYDYWYAYRELSDYITPLLSSLGTTSDIVGTTFRSKFKVYYDMRTKLLNAIATKAKQLADGAQSTATNANNKITAFMQEYLNDLGKIIAGNLAGNLNLGVTSILNSTGTFEHRDNMLYWQNQPTKAASTAASMWNSQGLSFAYGKNAQGDWIWKSIYDANGVIADRVTVAALQALSVEAVSILVTKLTAQTINGVNITGSNITADNGTIQVKLNPQGISPFEIWSLASGGSGVMKRQLYVLPHTNGGALCIDSGEFDQYGNARPYMSLSGDGGPNIRTGRLGSGAFYDFAISAPNTTIYGNHLITGSKSAMVKTDNYGKRLLYSEESDRLYFNTKGLANTHLTTDGKYQYIIRLDDVFLEVIELNSICPYIVNLTAYNNAHVWVKEVYDKYIIIESDKETKFSYNIQCTRKGYKDEYIREVI